MLNNTTRIRRPVPTHTRRQGLTLIEQAIVLLVIAVLMTVFMGVMITNNPFESTEDEAKKVAGHLTLIRNAAVKSNRVVIFIIDLDEDFYAAYYDERSRYREGVDDAEDESDVERDYILEPTDAAIRYIGTPTGKRIEQGRVTIHFLPNGVGEELALYLAEEDEEIQNTVIFSRYTGEAIVREGEVEHNLENREWRETVDEF
ncbi:MAG: hypothetical protein KDK27_15880 [Leptospiraceae bacterium]|nr:hypothetical protein [Leptospiraceae bacterium]